jgi:hypothetical protein
MSLLPPYEDKKMTSVLRTLIRAHAHYERGANNAGCIKDRGRTMRAAEGAVRH